MHDIFYEIMLLKNTNYHIFCFSQKLSLSLQSDKKVVNKIYSNERKDSSR